MSNQPRTTRARIFEQGSAVVLRYTHEFTGEPVERWFHVPGSSYIYDLDTNQQVCNGLDNMGLTLAIEDGLSLIDVIRREWRRRQRWIKQEGIYGYAYGYGCA